MKSAIAHRKNYRVIKEPITILPNDLIIVSKTAALEGRLVNLVLNRILDAIYSNLILLRYTFNRKHLFYQVIKKYE